VDDDDDSIRILIDEKHKNDNFASGEKDENSLCRYHGRTRTTLERTYLLLPLLLLLMLTLLLSLQWQ
jgi:hypothetical protein